MSDYDKLARVILLASGVREASYVHPEMDGVTYGHYRLTIDDAVEEVCPDDKQTAMAANFLLFNCWNDAHDWAHRQLYPAEMAYIECCHRVAYHLNSDLGEYYGGTPESITEPLYAGFIAAAELVRHELWARPLPA